MSRRSISGERGFTLVEVLVVILLVAILLMIVLPTFLNQRGKGEDVAAQDTIRTAQLALRTHETDEDTYDVTRADLEKIEPVIGEATGDFKVEGDTTSYTIVERSQSGTEFTLERDSSGKTTRDCDVPGHGLCRATLDADGNRW
jgi:type IV pilus assembly protein PilA